MEDSPRKHGGNVDPSSHDGVDHTLNGHWLNGKSQDTSKFGNKK
jgi:hypothetical protein